MKDNYSLIYEGGGFGPANLEAGATDEEPITEADIAQTMRDTGMSREEVMERLRAQGRI
jgi:NACalpha-BTF3-like transcription factor